jgi:hypothetical protein
MESLKVRTLGRRARQLQTEKKSLEMIDAEIERLRLRREQQLRVIAALEE